MVKASKGLRRRTRSKLRKRVRSKGLSPVTKMLESFKAGEKACIVIDPSIHTGQPHPKYQGITGVVLGAQGSSYLLKVKAGGKYKKVVVSPAHMKRIGEANE